MKKIVLEPLLVGLIFLIPFNALASSYSCYFWQPDQDVETIVISDSAPTKSVSLINKTQYVKISTTEELGLSIAHFEERSRDLLAVARGRDSSEVNLSIMNPRFSVSCYKEH